MTSESRLPHSTLNTYHTSTSLLYQFILSEFLISYQQMKAVNACVGHLRSVPKQSFSKEDYKKLLDDISTSITVMAGSSQEYMRLFTWSLGEGSVAKLKNYCAFLSEQEVKEDERLAAMHRCANRTWLLCLHSMDLLRNLQHVIQNPGPRSKGKKTRESAEELNLKESLCHSLEKMSHHMRRLARLIAQVTFDFKQDENILFFILRHNKEFDELYGAQFVHKLLVKMFPKGIKQAEQFVVKKYTIRGFEELIPTIRDKIQELQGE